jgi:hypothetical protein
MSYSTFPGSKELQERLELHVGIILDCLERTRDGYTVEQFEVPRDTVYVLRQLELVKAHVDAAIAQVLRFHLVGRALEVNGSLPT